MANVFFVPVTGHLPDEAPGTVLTVKAGIKAFAAVIGRRALATFMAEAGFVLLTDRHGLAIRMDSAFHRFLRADG